MNELNLSYESEGLNNYVTLKVKEGLSHFQVKMLESNQIPGLLSVHQTMLNGSCNLYYDITKMQRLGDVLREGVSGQTARKLLLCLLKTLVETEEYLLSMTRCVLHTDYIFIKNGVEVGLIYLPFSEKEVLSVEDVRMFYQNILAEYLTEDNDIYFLNLLKYVNKQEFSLAGLMERLEAGLEKQAVEKPVVENVGNSSPKAIFTAEPAKEEAPKPLFEFVPKKEKETEPKVEKMEENFGFSVPGMEMAAAKEVEKKDRKQNEKNELEKEKKSGLFGSLFGAGKKNTATEPEPVVAEESGQSKGMLFGKQKNKKSTSEEPEKKNEAGQEESGWSGTVILENGGAATELIGMQETPHLVYAGNSVSLANFPFRMGNGKVAVDFAISKPVISRVHASIQCSQGMYYVKDENSANHTYLNGKQLPPFTEVELHSGDVIRMANEEVTFYL